jgi:hypothetical protein
MDDIQYEAWVLEMLDKYKELYPEIAKDYYFYRIIYWKLESSHNVEIVRDDKFFNSVLPILKQTWNKILYYRKHQDKLDELKQIADKRKKYVKMTTSYLIHNNDIISNKFRILDDNFDIKQLIKKPQPKYSSYSYSKNFIKTGTKKDSGEKQKDYDSDYCDFIDNEECDFIDDVPVVDTKPVKSTKKVATEITQIKTESKIQNLINSKTIKHTEFVKKEGYNTSNNSTRKYDFKSANNPTKSFKSNSMQNTNDECDFID